MGVHLCSCPVFWPSVAWLALMWGHIWTTVLNSNKYSLLMHWLNTYCKFCLKKPDYYSVQIDKDKKHYELWNSIKEWKKLAKPLKYIEVCFSRDTSRLSFLYTLHKFHLHKVCCPYSSQSLANIGLYPGIKMLCDTLGCGQEREGHTWNCRAPIEISAHSSSSKDSGALMTMLARKRRINSSISNGSFNLSHRVDRAK